jgi:hypothetical protein
MLFHTIEMPVLAAGVMRSHKEIAVSVSRKIVKVCASMHANRSKRANVNPSMCIITNLMHCVFLFY